MYNNKHVLIVYDDLSKQAVAYRECPFFFVVHQDVKPSQDVFYLHSRLLERSAKVSDMNWVVALSLPFQLLKPKLEIFLLIATNVISITDGQIFLQDSLFNAGIRPAIDAGSSVSRVWWISPNQGYEEGCGYPSYRPRFLP